MKNILCILLFSVSFLNGYAQIEKNTSQAGISALPVLDVLNLFPQNSISGFGVMGNLGYFPIKNLSIGINPYYSRVSNSYDDYLIPYGDIRKEEKISLYGLNAYLRYYVFSKGKFSLYPTVSLGFGNLEKEIFMRPGTARLGHGSTSVLTCYAGAGVNYFITERVALELNVPYMYVQYLPPATTGFHTIAPTIGVQFYLSRSANSLAK